MGAPRGFDSDTVQGGKSVLRLLWKVVNLGLMATGFFVVLTILAVAGLLAWDYVDQAMAKNNEDDMLPAAPQPEATTTS